MMRYLMICIFLAGCSNSDNVATAMKSTITMCNKPVKLTAEFAQWGNKVTLECDELKNMK